jgi:hypothetical protein
MNSLVTLPATKERRSFGLHPKILLTIMREQAGSLSKALSELIMNSVDAGATRIDITIGESSFTVADDGHGFTSLEQLENFFEVFGTPHEEGDAYYGRFRIGRGQIMSYARTTWRSGPFEMRVDIAGDAADLGYDLLTHVVITSGCRIDGEFYKPNKVWHSSEDDICWGIADDFRRLIRYVPIPVFINGKQANKLPSEDQWDFEDDVAWYRFYRDDRDLGIYNRGVLVEYKKAAYFGTGGIVVTKQPLMVNMARNALIEHNCPTWKHVEQIISDRYRSRLIKAKKLDVDERAKLINDLLFGEETIYPHEAEQLRKIRFIPDIFGEVQSPDRFLAGVNYTLFNGKHTMIAERAQTHGRATVVMREMFYRTRLNTEEISHYGWAIARLRSRLCMSNDIQWLDFAQLVQEMDGTAMTLDDKDLKAEEMIVLEGLRYLNDCYFGKWLAGSSAKRRAVIAGVSDTMTAWTDGKTYIAIHRNALRDIRKSGAGKLILLIIHEYGHEDSSIGGHVHDFEFYHRFHRFAVTCTAGDLADQLFRRYVNGICKEGIVPSSNTGRHVRYLAERSPKFRSRIKAKDAE